MRRSCLTVLAVFVFATGTVAESKNGRIHGIVRDQATSIIPGAEVVLTNVKTEAKLTTRTNKSGEYAFEVPPGEYRLTATGPNFSVNMLTSFQLKKNQTLQKDFALGGQTPPQPKPRWVPLGR